MLEESLLADLVTELTAPVRLERLVVTLKSHFGCQAVALLKLEPPMLRPVAAIGLQREVLGRRFDPAQHPRLQALLQSRQVVHFAPDCDWPDPYDGLVDGVLTPSMPVHDCMGISLYLEGQCWGVLTLDALQAGTFSRLTVLELQRFSLLVEAVLRIGNLETMVRQARLGHGPQADLNGQVGGHELVGQDPQLLQVMHELDLVASTEMPVLLLGETGVGKELFAKRLHQQSLRRQKPMVYVNCAALPETLAESELFGHRKGAFSGAATDRCGKFEQADGGTLFLDEIGELPMAVQAKLLRVLQNGEIQRLGADQYRQVNVRVVAATNRQLEDEVQQGRFRSDLFHRLSVYPLTIPPLRQRQRDISLLAGHFLEQNRARLGVRALRLSLDAAYALEHYRWPGNIRELEHAISRAALKALSQGQSRHEIVTIDAATLDLLPVPGLGGDLPTAAVSPPVASMPLKLAVAQLQRQLIEHALAEHQQNWAQAARALALDASNLHKLASRLGLKAPARGV